MKKFLAMALALLLLVLMLPMTAAAEDGVYPVSTEEQFRIALGNLTGPESQITVKLENNITISSDLSVNQGKLTILGQEHTLSFNNGSLIIGGSATVNLGAEDGSDTLILTSTDNTRCVVGMNGSSTLNMYEGVTIKDSRSGGQAGGVQLEDQAVFNMHGGVIDNCVNWASVAGGVCIDGGALFNMYDGVIRNCSGWQGGAVTVSGAAPISGGYISGSSGFHMYGGTIRDCHDNWQGGGAVCADTEEPISFIMDGGTITGCSADGDGYGGAIFVNTKNAGAVIKINKGEITGNKGTYGGGIYVKKGNVEIADGVALHNNTATDAGDDLYNNGSGAVIVLGKTGSGLTLSSCGHTIDGWYYDGAPRWSSSECSEGAEDHMTAYEMIGVPNPAECGLKAAHGAQKNGGGVIIIEPEDPAEPEEPEDNPATGTNDFVSAAVAVAAVSLLGMAAVLRKK